MLAEKQLCVICHIREVIPSGDRYTCYDLMCQIRYNELKNISPDTTCKKCGRHTLAVGRLCYRCKGAWKHEA